MPVSESLLATVKRIGFVQIDSVDTVARAHHMILSARRRDYRPSQLSDLLEAERSLFENWTHDASAIPTAFYPHWRLRFRRGAARLRERWRTWRRAGFEEKFDGVLDHIRRNGPVMARELRDGSRRKGTGWWDWHPSKTALEYLWRTGELAVTRREGFQKVFDLTERVIPQMHRSPTPEERETLDWACSSALDRLGFATPGEIAAFWATATPSEAKAWCATRLAEGELAEIEVEGAAPDRIRKVVARPDGIGEPVPAPKRIRVISPFDPLIRDRRRTEWLFGFSYTIEIFVPAAKRRYGYYVFPLLEGERFMGRVDMRRRDGVLAVRAFWPEPGVRPGRGRMGRLEGELERIARFAGCDGVRYANGWIRTAPDSPSRP